MKILESNSEMAARKVVDVGSAVQPLHALINPVIGPEAVTGSSRMKGGSATMVILDILCLKALHYSGRLTAAQTHPPDGADAITAHVAGYDTRKLLNLYHQVHKHTFASVKKLYQDSWRRQLQV